MRKFFYSMLVVSMLVFLSGCSFETVLNLLQNTPTPTIDYLALTGTSTLTMTPTVTPTFTDTPTVTSTATKTPIPPNCPDRLETYERFVHIKTGIRSLRLHLTPNVDAHVIGALFDTSYKNPPHGDALYVPTIVLKCNGDIWGVFGGYFAMRLGDETFTDGALP